MPRSPANAAHAASLAQLPAETADHVPIDLLADVESSADAEAAALLGSDGVGLYRTELEFVVRPRYATEDEQFRFMKRVAARFHPQPVAIRVLDLGANGSPSRFQLPPAGSAVLADHGIRVLLEHRDLFRRQLCAILRVSAFHPVSILLPRVATVADIVAARSVLEEAKLSLAGDGTAFNAAIPLGALIETPDAATNAELLAPHVDFLSVGTDNLLQQGLGSGWPHAPSQLGALDPRILRLLEAVAAVASREVKGLSIGGEMAADPDLTPLLLGLGLRALIVTPNRLLEVKAAIRRTRLDHARKFAEAALKLDTSSEVLEAVKRAR